MNSLGWVQLTRFSQFVKTKEHYLDVPGRGGGAVGKGEGVASFPYFPLSLEAWGVGCTLGSSCKQPTINTSSGVM